MYSVRTSDLRVTAVEPLLSPAALRKEIPLPLVANNSVLLARQEIARILRGEDDRVVVVTGPCSIHDPDAALNYAERLSHLSQQVADQILIVMRVYVEKPRTRRGWKGLVSDPRLDGSHDLTSGLRLARGLMVDIVETGLPIATEFLDPIVARYLSDVTAWGAIGARTVQSQPHRQLTSGLAMPMGIKNGTNGGVADAIDAIVAASEGHVVPGIDENGVASIVTTSGNPDCHVVLRGGSDGPNYGAAHVARALEQLDAAGLPKSLFIDASHGNSGKDHNRQPIVVADIADRIAAGEPGVAGLMIESFLTAGNQSLVLGRTEDLIYGQSVTDACVDWNQTVDMVEQLANAVSARRRANHLSALAG